MLRIIVLYPFLAMRYLIISDIHGCEPALDGALRFFHEGKFDYLLVLGDILNYGPRNRLPEGLNPKGIAEKLNALADRIIAIRGNCDSEVDQMLLDFPCLADYALVMDNGKRLFLTHGHIYNEEKRPKGSFDLLVYGHTHLWKLERTEQGVVCNTGSITFPKNGNPPTFATCEDGIVRVYHTNGTLLKELAL